MKIEDTGDGTTSDNNVSRELVNGREVFTLCGTSGCCPTVRKTVDGASVEITDDFGGKITIPMAAFVAMQGVKFER